MREKHPIDCPNCIRVMCEACKGYGTLEPNPYVNYWTIAKPPQRRKCYYCAGTGVKVKHVAEAGQL